MLLTNENNSILIEFHSLNKAMKDSELLVPVGNYQMCLAAIHNGADAIYVGMPTFNARGRSHDHSWEELTEIIQTCHLYGVHVHLAFNILIFEDEIAKAIATLDRAVKIGPDALIVQDIGLISLIKQRYPDLCIHGSTQMTVTNHEAIELLSDLNITRFVLGRENSLDEIRTIKENTNKELEVFVHGALCVAYSGQCFTSESLGGRSANRGQCAQSCRFDYEIYVDDKKKELKNIKYLVSPKDLCGINEIPKLQEIGVDSFKIEGRLKSSEYVATVAKNYKSAMQGSTIKNESLVDMATTYSRGFYTGWLNGVAHQELSLGDTKSHRGYPLGRIVKIQHNKIYLNEGVDIQKGDGLLIEFIENNEVKEIGERVYEVSAGQNLLAIGLGRKVILKNLSGNERVYLNRKESVIKAVKKSTTDRAQLKRIPLKIKLYGNIGNNLEVHVDDGLHQFKCLSSVVIEAAQSTPINDEALRKNLFGLSHTPYIVEEFENKISDEFYINNKALKQLKNDFVAKLNQLRTEVRVQAPKEVLHKQKNKIVVQTKLNILIRKKEQLTVLLNYFEENKNYQELLGYIILDYEFGKDYFSSVKEIRNFKYSCAIATTRILKPGEYHTFTLIERCKPDAILVRNLGALNFFKEKDYKLLGDFSLNCSNSHSFDYLVNKGLESLSASYDLNLERLEFMLQNIDASKLEITIHQYMPEFHMEHCVFAAFLSDGNSYKNCGKPCEKHEVYLKDMYGNRHEIKADQECRNTMFNAKAQSTTEYLHSWSSKNVGYFRFEALHESSVELVSKVDVYLKLLSGEIDNKAAKKSIGEKEVYGLGVGHLGFANPYKNRKKLD